MDITLSFGEWAIVVSLIVSVTTIVISNKNSNKSNSDDFKRLEKKQDKYNNIIARTLTLEKLHEEDKANKAIKEKERVIEQREVHRKLDSIYGLISKHVENYHTVRGGTNGK